MVDDLQDPQNISGLFKDKFENLFNSVSYNIDELNRLQADINRSIIDSYDASNINTNGIFTSGQS